jgi:hypothetical protein
MHVGLEDGGVIGGGLHKLGAFYAERYVLGWALAGWLAGDSTVGFNSPSPNQSNRHPNRFKK